MVMLGNVNVFNITVNWELNINASLACMTSFIIRVRWTFFVTLLFIIFKALFDIKQ